MKTLDKNESDWMNLNDIARVEIKTLKPICFDPYSKNRATGSFILIDELTNNTVAAGMIQA
jgi:sulfate adenylyltransferase subunit 1 (EFTu-like GTPase family)